MAKDYSELDAKILAAIQSFDGIPTAPALSRVLPYSCSFIQSRLNANPSLCAVQDTCGERYVCSLSEDQFISQTAIAGNLQSKALDLPITRKEIYSRIDQIILGRIQFFDGIPVSSDISAKNFYAEDFIQARINANPSLKSAQEKRGIEYVQNLPEEDFIEQTAKRHGFQLKAAFLPNVLARVYE